MEEIDEMYLVELLSGVRIRTNSFLAVNDAGKKFFANEFFRARNENKFEALMNNIQQWGVIVDSVGVGKWAGLTFHNIQFISPNEDFCRNFILLKTQESAVLYNKMDLVEKNLLLIRNTKKNDALFKLTQIEYDNNISQLDNELSEVRDSLTQLLSNNDGI